jgi:hypothetical protein
MRWIIPQLQMPKDGEPVLITDREGLQVVAWWNEHDQAWHSESRIWFPPDVLIWMPIPENYLNA